MQRSSLSVPTSSLFAGVPRAVCAAAVLLLTGVLTAPRAFAAATVVVNDTWQDGTRTDPASPTYAENNGAVGTDADSDGDIESAWFNAGSASTLVASAGHLVATPGTGSQSFSTYFTAAGTPVTLTNPGDSIKVTWVFTPNGVATSGTSQAFNFALVRAATDSRLTADGSPPTAVYAGYAMYTNMATTLGNGNPFQLRRWNLGATAGNFLNSSSNWLALANGATSGNTGYASGTTYTFTMTIERDATTPTTLNVTSTMSGGSLNNTGTATVTYSDATPNGYTFDLFGVRPSAAGSSASSFDTTRFKVEYTNALAPTVTTQPVTQTANAGANVTLTVEATGQAPLTYQWQKKPVGGSFANITDATSSSLALTGVQAGDAGDYRAVVTNSAGSDTSAAATLTVATVGQPPVIETQPQSATILVGGSNTFSVFAASIATLSYQWSFSANGGSTYSEISGATSASYAITTATLSDTGLYRVAVTNATGTVTSDAATLTVNQVPSFTTQPTGANLQTGQSLTLTAAATIGTPAPAYQWKLNNAAISGATGASYTIAAATGADTGNYTVVATNAAGSATSATAVVNVLSSTLATAGASPANSATGVFPDQPLTITFNAPIAAGLSGSIKIFDAASPSTPVDTIGFDAAAARTASASILALPVQTKTVGGQTGLHYYPVTIAGSTLTLYPRDGALTYGKTYYVTVDAGTIVDATGATFAGFSDNTTWSFATKAAGPGVGATHLTVAPDGSGDFYTVQGALDFIPANNTTPTTIYIKNGTYYELVSWTAKSNITFLGQSRDGVVIGYPNNNNFNPTGTAWRAAFTCRGGNSTGMVITNLTIKNFTPKTGSQAEALYLSGSATAMQAIITHVNLSSYQDTLLINGQAYISDSYIEGDTDFMWGNGPVYFTNCELKALSIQSYYTQIRNPATNHGFVYVNCKFSAADTDSQSANPVSGCYLGRLDQNANPHTEVVLLNSTEGDHILPVGWNLNGQTVGGAAATNCVEFNPLKISDHSAVDVSQRASWSYQWASPANDAQIAHYSDSVWVLNTAMDGTPNSSWTPALAPIIVSQPASVTVDSGQPAVFAVSVAAVPAANYQWQKDGADIVGATTATYTIANAAGADAGSYTVVVTNSAGSPTSSAATLTVGAAATAPAITTQPQSQTVYAGDAVTFSVVATGTTPLAYQWKFAGADIVGATSASLTLPAVQLTDAGDYTVAVSNSVDTATSAAATLTVQPAVVTPTAPTANPATAVSGTGFTANWSNVAGATGYRLDVSTDSGFATFVPAYQDLDVGATFSRAITGLSAGTYYYRVRATNSAGASGASAPVTVVIAAPATSISIVSGGSTSDASYSLGGAPYTQTFDSLPSSGTFTWANSSTLAGWYAAPTAGAFDPAGVVIDGSSNMVDLKIGSLGTIGSTERALAYHTRLNTAPTYLGLAFTNQSGRVLDSFTLTYTPEQWREKTTGRDMTFTVEYRVGATSTDLNATSGWTTLSDLAFTSASGSVGKTATLTSGPVSVAVADGATIWFRWVTANSATSSTSSNDIIAIDNVGASFTAVPDGSPVITTPPASQTIDPGSTVTLSVVASGDAPFTYQWSKDGAPLSGETFATLTLAHAADTSAGDYVVVVTNAKGAATSLPATLTISTVVNAPLIVTQPQSQSVDTGATVVFTVTATGTAPLNYQWFKNGTAIAAALSDTLTLNNVQPADAGAYTAIVSNGAGSDTSAVASLELTGVVTPPVILAQSGSQSVVIGGAVNFSVSVGGSGPFTYQWSKDGGAIPDATAPTLTLTNVQLAAAGNYTVTVTNAASSVTSDPVALTVNEPPAVGEGSIFAAPDGFAGNPGTFAQPTSLANAITLVPAGGTIYVRGGTYAMSTELRIERGNNGSDGQLKHLVAYVPPGGAAEKPVFDFSSQPYGNPSNVSNPRGVWLGGNYWHLKGLEIKNAADNGVYVVGNHNIVELCRLHGNRDTGLQIGRYSSSAPRSEWPTHNLILNCESYDNDDVAPGTGENADGFACKLTAGAGNVFRGCISHNNIDDGWDLYTKSETGPIDPVVIDQCISYNNGTLTNGTQNTAGDRNGFKLGGEKIAVAHYVSRCISFNNGKNGFTWNSNPGAIVLVNNLAWDNVEGNYKFDSGEATFYNNVSLWTTSSGPGNRNGVNDRYVGNSGIPTGASNIFWFVGSSSRGPSINDASLTAYKTAFVTLTVPVGGFTRNADGSIALGDFARPVASSPLVNAGVLPPGDVIGQFPFATAGYYEDAPDLGAVETYLHTPPTIVTAPQSQSILTGASFTLDVSVQGTTPFTFQWSKDGSPIGGATASTYTVATATTGDSGSYTVAITNAVSTVTSGPAVVTVGAATGPSVTTQPAAQSVYVGGSATFSVVVGGTAPFTFQWKKDGSPISGATGGAYTVANAQSSDAGGYTVVVTNSIDSVTSDVATLTVTDSPEAPVAAAATAVSNTGFTASWSAVNGATSYRLDVSASSSFDTFVSGYQDLDVGSDLSRALTGLSSGTAYYYRVRAVHAAGTSYSSNVVSVVTAGAATTTLDASQLTWFKTRTADSITTGVNSVTFNEGQTSASSFTTYLPNAINLAVGQKLTLTLVFQMGGNVAVATNALRFGLFNANGTRITASANSETNAVVADDTGYVASYNIDSGTGKLLARIPGSTNTTLMGSTGATLYTDLVAANPSGTTAALTASTTYTLTYVVARLADASEFTATLAGGGISAYVLTGTDPTTDSRVNGTYDQLAVRIAGGSGSFNALTIAGLSYSIEAAGPSAPSIDTQPASVAGVLGANATFTVVASGTPPLTYQWRKDNVAISGATSATLALTNLTLGDAGSYTVTVTNDLGHADSAAAVLTVTAATPPVFTTQPQSASVAEGANVTFTAAATGTDPLTYQWKKNGSAIGGATTATLTLNAVQPTDAGDYVLTATNSADGVDSAVATLTVQAAPPQKPVIATQPLAQTVAAGSSATFTVVATGTAPLAYQWTKDGGTLTGATASSLTVTNVQAANLGTYAVTVSNSAGSVTSDAVALNLTSALPVTEFNLTGFATVGAGTTGGGVIPDTDPAYRKVSTPLDLVQAIADSNKTAGKVKVIEIMNDLNLGWNEVGSTVQNLASNPLRSHATPKLHPVLIQTGVSVLDIKARSPLTIFSANGATIKHVTFNVKGTSNIIIRNLKFDEMWEWDESSKGNYDSNDWDFIDLSNGGDVSNVWIDHCTFTKAYDGIVDLKAGTTNVTLSWCKYIGDDGAANPHSFVRQQLAALEANKASYAFYKYLRDTCGYSVDDIATIIQGHDKGHLMGSNSLKTENDSLTGTFHHLWMKNVWDRAVPRLRGGNVHDYNIFVDDTEALAARRLRDATAALLTTAQQNTLNNTYSFRPPLNGAISTEGGSVLVEKSIYKDCLWPLRNNQTDPSNAIYTGKIKALDSIYSFLNPDSSTTVVRGDSTDANNPMGPFQAAIVPFAWDLAGGVLPYTCTMDDPAQLPAILEAGAGAGVLTWSKDNWLRTAYVVDHTIPPSIAAQPRALSVASGVDATFTVQAGGSATLAYQWSKDGSALADGGRVTGATSAVLTIAAATAADAGSYSVVVTNANGHVTSDAVALVVTSPIMPSIVTQPQSQLAAVDGDVEFRVVAAGSAPFTYQWQHDGVDLVEATGPSLTLSPLQLADAGAYRVVVTNVAGSVISASATLTLGMAPVAPVATAATNVRAGGFTANWTGSTDATGYRVDVSASAAFDTLVAGFANVDAGPALSLAVSGLAPSTNYYYRVRAYNTYGTGADSSPMLVTTAETPPGTTIDVSQLTWYKSRAADTIAADAGAGTVMFTEGQTSASTYIAYLPSAVDLAVGQALTLTFTLQTGNTLPSTSNALRLALFNSNGTRLAANPSGDTNAAFIDEQGYLATYNFGSGAGSLYARTPGGTNDNLMGTTGQYVSLAATNPSGTTAGLAPSTTYTVTYTIARLADVTLFWVQLDGGGASSYLLTGADGDSGSFGTATFDEIALRFAGGSNSVNSVTLSPLHLAVQTYVPYTQVPAITTQPVSQTVAVASGATFTVAATGIAPLAYQWSKDGAAVPGATTATLSLPTVQFADAGNYTVTVSNLAGGTTSGVATLTVPGAPVTPGAPVSLAATDVTATGFTAHWNSVADATGYRFDVSTSDTFSSLVTGYADLDLGAALSANVTGLAASTNYYYRVRAYNSAGASSASAAITVATGDVTVTPGTPTLTWSPPAAIVYGTALSDTQLNATADVAGAFAYTPAAGTVLNAGADQTLSVTFAPTDSVHYTTATVTVSLTVNQATPRLTWAAPEAIDAGTVLSAMQLNAAANVPGTFVYTPATGTVLTAGSQTLSVTFTPTDSANYTTATGSTSLTVNPLITVPAITTAPVSQSITVGEAASFSVVASGTGPFTYQWLKDGVAIDGATGATLSFASTAVTDAGSYSVVITNAAGSVTSTPVSLTATVPSFTGIYFGQFTAGGDWALSINADNTGVFIANLPQRQSVIVLNVTLAADGSFTVTGSEIRSTASSAPTVAIAGNHAPQALGSGQFTLSGQIVHQSVVGQLEGLDESFTGAADAPTGAAQAVSGYYAAAALGTSEGGLYTVIGASGQALVVSTTPTAVGGGTGTVDASGQLSITTANAAQITLAVNAQSQSVAASVLPSGATTPVSFAGLNGTATSTSRLVNLSVRSGAGNLDQTLIMGFVVAGSGSQDVLMRGIGPGLVPYGVPAATVLADPQVRLFNNTTGAPIDENDDWGGTVPLVVKSSEVGAFVIPANSKDAALLAPLTAGAYSGHVTTTGTVSGLALIEIYDATMSGDAHFVNVSVRSVAKTGDGVLIAGFVITGNAPKKLLIRGVGPSLVAYGVSAASVLPDPTLVVYQGSTAVATNDNWGGATALKDAFHAVGAFDLSSDSTKDAAAIVTLEPGVYTVQVSGVNNTSGVALVEIYDVSP